MGSAWARGLKLAAVVLVSCLAAACGGGGGGDAATTPVAPGIDGMPQSQSVRVTAVASFAVVATGTAPLSYQWLRDGAPIAGATGPRYDLSTTLADSGARFSVVVGNAAGRATSSEATLTVLPALLRFVVQPTAQVVSAGTTARFSAEAAAEPSAVPLQYQWQRDGVPVAGATAPSLSVAAVSRADDGARFTVTVSGGGSTLTSDAAALTVEAAAGAPALTSAPQDARFIVGGRAVFSVAASGTDLRYQWRVDGVDIPGADAATLRFGPLTPLDDGRRFSVVVSNAAGSIETPPATLGVRRAAVGVSAAGWQYIAAADADGRSWTWTGSSAPYLGLGATLPGSTIRDLGPNAIVDVALQGTASLLLRQDGTVLAWGQDQQLGLLGQGSASLLAAPTPLNVPGVDGAVSLSAGVATNYAVRGDGTVWRWGRREVYDAAANRLSTFYDGTAAIDPLLRDVQEITQSRNGASGYAVLKDGTVLAWGDNGKGQLGDGTTVGQGGTVGRFVPAPIADLTDVATMAAAQTSALAVKRDGTVWTWGTDWLGYGAAPGARSLRPQQVPGIGDAVKAWASSNGYVVLRRDGTLLTWGNMVQASRNDDFSFVRSYTPVAVTGVDNVVAAALGWDFGLALRADGRIFTWGINRGQTAASAVPTLPFQYTVPEAVAIDLAP